jgi:hypothetical protein
MFKEPGLGWTTCSVDNSAGTAKAIKNDAISIPTPGELFAALSKPGKPNWSGQYRAPMAMTYRNRAQIALNLGGLIADGFVAVEFHALNHGARISDFFAVSEGASA